jgi:hypothetical protein
MPPQHAELVTPYSRYVFGRGRASRDYKQPRPGAGASSMGWPLSEASVVLVTWRSRLVQCEVATRGTCPPSPSRAFDAEVRAVLSEIGMRRGVDHRHSARVSSCNAMNQFESSAKPRNEREGDVRRLSEFHAVFLGVAGQHDLQQPVQVIQSTDEFDLIHDSATKAI